MALSNFFSRKKKSTDPQGFAEAFIAADSQERRTLVEEMVKSTNRFRLFFKARSVSSYIAREKAPFEDVFDFETIYAATLHPGLKHQRGAEYSYSSYYSTRANPYRTELNGLAARQSVSPGGTISLLAKMKRSDGFAMVFIFLEQELARRSGSIADMLRPILSAIRKVYNHPSSEGKTDTDLLQREFLDYYEKKGRTGAELFIQAVEEDDLLEPFADDLRKLLARKEAGGLADDGSFVELIKKTDEVSSLATEKTDEAKKEGLRERLNRIAEDFNEKRDREAFKRESMREFQVLKNREGLPELIKTLSDITKDPELHPLSRKFAIHLLKKLEPEDSLQNTGSAGEILSSDLENSRTSEAPGERSGNANLQPVEESGNSKAIEIFPEDAPEEVQPNTARGAVPFEKGEGRTPEEKRVTRNPAQSEFSEEDRFVITPENEIQVLGVIDRSLDKLEEFRELVRIDREEEESRFPSEASGETDLDDHRLRVLEDPFFSNESKFRILEAAAENQSFFEQILRLLDKISRKLSQQELLLFLDRLIQDLEKQSDVVRHHSRVLNYLKSYRKGLQDSSRSLLSQVRDRLHQIKSETGGEPVATLQSQLAFLEKSIRDPGNRIIRRSLVDIFENIARKDLTKDLMNGVPGQTGELRTLSLQILDESTPAGLQRRHQIQGALASPAIRRILSAIAKSAKKTPLDYRRVRAFLEKIVGGDPVAEVKRLIRSERPPLEPGTIVGPEKGAKTPFSKTKEFSESNHGSGAVRRNTSIRSEDGEIQPEQTQAEAAERERVVELLRESPEEGKKEALVFLLSLKNSEREKEELYRELEESEGEEQRALATLSRKLPESDSTEFESLLASYSTVLSPESRTKFEKSYKEFQEKSDTMQRLRRYNQELDPDRQKQLIEEIASDPVLPESVRNWFQIPPNLRTAKERKTVLQQIGSADLLPRWKSLLQESVSQLELEPSAEGLPPSQISEPFSDTSPLDPKSIEVSQSFDDLINSGLNESPSFLNEDLAELEPESEKSSDPEQSYMQEFGPVASRSDRDSEIRVSRDRENQTGREQEKPRSASEKKREAPLKQGEKKGKPGGEGFLSDLLGGLGLGASSTSQGTGAKPTPVTKKQSGEKKEKPSGRKGDGRINLTKVIPVMEKEFQSLLKESGSPSAIVGSLPSREELEETIKENKELRKGVPDASRRNAAEEIVNKIAVVVMIPGEMQAGSPASEIVVPRKVWGNETRRKIYVDAFRTLSRDVPPGSAKQKFYSFMADEMELNYYKPKYRK